MSIARTAPDSFEFQDLACIETVLRFKAAGAEVERFVVEPKGGEDGSLHLSGSATLHFELQIKSGAGTVGLADLALWLTHFPERQDTDMLFERLARDDTRRLLIIVTGRAADALDPLVVNDDWAGGPLRVDPSAELANDLLEAFRRSGIDDTGKGNLHSKRVTHHSKAAGLLTSQQVRDVLRRIAIVDRATKTSILHHISRHLRSRGIPDDATADSIPRLRAAVSLKRAGGDDLAAALEAQIAKDVPTSVAPLGYVVGDDEARWVQQLRTLNCLLLSGVTRSGKTTTARWIAAQFEAQGARIGEFGNVEDAERSSSIQRAACA